LSGKQKREDLAKEETRLGNGVAKVDRTIETLKKMTATEDGMDLLRLHKESFNSLQEVSVFVEEPSSKPFSEVFPALPFNHLKNVITRLRMTDASSEAFQSFMSMFGSQVFVPGVDFENDEEDDEEDEGGYEDMIMY
jgi:hypothetical protein